MSGTQPKQRALPPAWMLPRAAVLLGTLVAVDPVALSVVTGSGLVVTTVTVGMVVVLQASYKPQATWPLFAYVVNFLTLGSLLMHGEYLLRTSWSGYQVPNIYRLERGYSFNLPMLDMTFEDNEYRAAYLTNAQGHRIGETVDPTRPITQADWIFLGDSFTQGAQVPFDSLYTSKLFEAFPDRTIVNLGASGLGISQELALYLDRGTQLKPSVVFLQISAFNDFMNVEPKANGLSDRLMEKSALYRTAMYRSSFTDRSRLPLGRWTEPFYPDRESNRRFNVFYRETSTTKEEDLKRFAEYVHQFKTTVENDGARLILILLPTREQISAASLTEVTKAFGIEYADLNMLRPNELVAALAQELDIALVDLFPRLVLEGSDAFFERDEHLSAHGHAAVADGIRDAISSWAGNTNRRRKIAPIEGSRYPRSSCGGTRISFQAPVRGPMEVFTVDRASAGVVQLTRDGAPKSHPALSRDCDMLSYTRGNPELIQTDVMLVDLSTGRASDLTPGPDKYGAIPAFSPDARHIAFAEWFESESGSMTNPVISLVALDTGAKQQLTRDSHESWRPAFSPDGQRLAYIANPSGQFDVFERDLSTGAITQLTNTPYDEWDPSYSHTGEDIVYAAHEDGNWDLFSLTLESGENTRLTATSGDEWDPTFGPDDKSVLFATQFAMFAGAYEMSIQSGEH